MVADFVKAIANSGLSKNGRNKNMKNLSIMVVGVGGQGTLLTSRIIGNVALSQNFDVKLSEVHGMAQRGGIYHERGQSGCRAVRARNPHL